MAQEASCSLSYKMEIEEIFLNKFGRLRSGWRLMIFALVVFFTIAQLFQLAHSAGSILEGNWGFVVQALILLIPATVVGWACGHSLEGLPLRALGWAFKRGWFTDFLRGALFGAASLLFATAIITVSGGYSFKLNAPLMLASTGQTLLISGIIFLIAAAGEEALFRGYPLQTMTRARFAWFGIIITSLVFAWGHLGNPNVAPAFTFINTTLAGVWLAVGYLRTRNLWFPLGVHWAWNWTMGAVLGLPVSGIERLTPAPLLRAADSGPGWLTGGSYGLEGGVACTIALLLSTIFIWRTRLLRADLELMRLTNQENPKRIEPPLTISPQPASNNYLSQETETE
jgi:membrane protease YdiL (CAAX protease family)